METYGDQPNLPPQLIKQPLSDRELLGMSDDDKMRAWIWRSDTVQECERFWQRIHKLLKGNIEQK